MISDEEISCANVGSDSEGTVQERPNAQQHEMRHSVEPTQSPAAIPDAAAVGGIAPGEQSFFFHVEADHDAHGGWRDIHGRSVGTAAGKGKVGACQNGPDA